MEIADIVRLFTPNCLVPAGSSVLTAIRVTFPCGAFHGVLDCKLKWVTFCGSNTGAFEEKTLINSDKL